MQLNVATIVAIIYIGIAWHLNVFVIYGVCTTWAVQYESNSEWLTQLWNVWINLFEYR